METALYFLVSTTILWGLADGSGKYCNVESCEGKTNTGCIYSLNDIGQNCGTILSTGVSEEEIVDIVEAHNDYRRLVASGQEKRGNPGPQPPSNNINLLEWSNELQQIAQLWANQCPSGHDACRDTDTYTVGQNIAKVWSTRPPRRGYIRQMISDWFEEVVSFNKNFVKSLPYASSGHYTQLIWGETKYVGCGVVQYRKGGMIYKLLVCNYAPAGNVIGAPVYKTKHAYHTHGCPCRQHQPYLPYASAA